MEETSSEKLGYGAPLSTPLKVDRMAEFGAIVWYELGTSDLDAAKAFYAATLGWIFEEISTPVGPYTLARSPSRIRPVAGLLPWPSAESGADQWFAYVAVDDVEAAAARALAAGGRATPIYEIPGVGRFSTVTDPNGASLGMMQRSPQT